MIITPIPMQIDIGRENDGLLEVNVHNYEGYIHKKLCTGRM